jgi:hypothetical protein
MAFSIKKRKLDISTILTAVKAQNISGALDGTNSSTASSTLMAVLREKTAFGVASTITFPEADNSRVSRNINDIQYNTLGITVVAPNFIIPGSGSFKIVARANFSATWQVITTSGNWGVVRSRLYLRDETNNVNEVLVGDSYFGEQIQIDVNNRALPAQGVATLTGVFTQATTTTYSIQQICNTQFQNVRIMGYPQLPPTKTGGTPVLTESTNPEYYVNVEITKLA